MLDQDTTQPNLERTRDLSGRGGQPWARRAVLAVLTVFVLLGLAGVMGQRTVAQVDATSAAHLRVVAPSTLRGGLLWPARIEVRALRDIRYPRLVLGPGWVKGMQLNTIEPGAAGEATRNGRLVLSYDALAAGDSLIVYLQAQVNPTTVGRQDISVALDDKTTPLARVGRSTMVLP